MKNPAQVLDQLLPLWRQLLPQDFPRPYFDAFVVRQRTMLEQTIAAWLERRAQRRAAGPESETPNKRTRRNLDAMRLVATRRPQDMTAEERGVVLGYSGWGGLSIEHVMDQFPPGLVPDDFALIHEYYTPQIVADAIAGLVCPRLGELAGFDGIVRALEPSVGIGRLVRALGPPRCLVSDPRYKELRWTAVELSAVSAKMFAAMRPDVELYQLPFEQWAAEHSAKYHGTLNLILTNPPYGQRGEYASRDKHPDSEEKRAYAYFLLRSFDLLVPGGLAVPVVPAGFLTGAKTRALRERLLRRNHLEVAFRLPSESTTGHSLFPGAGNVVDVHMWRARGGELSEVDAADRFILDGHYFEENPTHILGVEKTIGGGVSEKTGKKKFTRHTVVGDFTGFPAFTPRPLCQTCSLQSVPVFQPKPAEPVVRDMTDEPGDLAEELRHAMDLGRRVDRYLALVADEDERALGLYNELHAALESLRKTSALAALEGNPWRWIELRKLAERRAVAQRLLAAFQKTGDLSPSLASPPKIRPKFRAQPDDVLAQAEHLFRRSRRLTLSELTAFHRDQGGKLNRTAILEALLAADWCRDGEDWEDLEPAASYLTGKLWPKHDAAAERAASDPQAARQLQRLQAAMALAVFEDIRDISPRQGWLPLELVSTWLGETLNHRYGVVELTRDNGLIHPKGQQYTDLGARSALTPETLWCIGWMNHDNTLFKPKLEDDEIAKLQAEDAAATGQTPNTAEEDDTDSEDDEEDVKIGQIRLLLGRHWNRAFAGWVAAREDRRAAVTSAYNRAFRGTIIPTFEGDSLDIARWNPNGPQLKDHQNRGARRLTHLGFGLLAFDVGVGKTFTAIAAMAYLRQQGRVHRPVFLVPGSLVWQWYDNFMCVLPDYRVVVIGSNRKRISRGARKDVLTSETDTPEQRAEKWTALQAGLVDVVILSYDALHRTKLNEQALLEHVAQVDGIQRQIKLRQRNAAEKSSDKLSERERAILKHGARAWVEEMLELPEGHKFDPGIAWDDIGIDMLVVDEATAFKNSYKPEPREHGVPKFMGNPGDGSKRAWQLDFRAAAVRRHTGGTGIVLMTATPAKNSPLEFYNMIQLMDPYAFSKKGLMDPEQFIDRFLRIESREIIDITLKVATRSVVDGFVNLDDLRTIIRTYGEFRSAAEVGIQLPEPRSEQVHVQMNDAQESEYDRLVRKIESTLQRMRAGGQGQGTILGILQRMSMISLHPKLGQDIEYQDALKAVHPEDYAAPKLIACAERIAASPGCGHIVFCEPVAVHRWLTETLVAHGVPRERIAILNAIETKPADRIRIARQFNGIADDPAAAGGCAGGTAQRVPPKFDVLIANSVANEGLDAQTRTCALHHLDLPWTSSDLEQRNGRGVRQGNENASVRIYYYMSERSMDWYRYQLIQGKRAWLSALLDSQARDTSNPGAQKSLSDEEILMMISRNPEATKKAIESRREALRADARYKVAREASTLLIQASARFRDARDTVDAEKAARLRAEGEERLKDLRRVDVDAWPWVKWTTQVREVEYMVPSSETAPVFEGLRARTAAGKFIEFGRIVESDAGRQIGKRELGAVTWTLVGSDDVRQLALEPAALDAGAQWPDEVVPDYAAALGEHIQRTLVLGTSIADLQWRGASDAWLSRWWPHVERAVREALVRAGQPSADEDTAYPIVADEKLSLAQGEALRRGELLPPTLVGWRRYLDLAPKSRLKSHELRQAALVWWDRRLPRGLVAAAPGDAVVEPESTPIEPELPEPELPPVAPPHVPKQVPPAFTDHVIRNFDTEPGFRLRLEHRGTQGRYIFAVLREGADDEVASIDVENGAVTHARWLDSAVRPAQQRDIVARLERALRDAELRDAAAADTAPDAASSLRPLIETLERLGRESLGMDLQRVLDTARQDPLQALAVALKDLAEPVTTTPEGLALKLDDAELWAAAEVLRDPDVLAFRSVDEVLDRLWAALDKAVPLTKIKRRSGGIAVEQAAIAGEDNARMVLVRTEGKTTRYSLRGTPVKVQSCDGTRCGIDDPTGSLKAGAEVYLLDTRHESFIHGLHEQAADLERTLRDAPRLLADVRQLLLLAGALIDTQRCQGKEQAAALRAFEEAKRYHDVARRMLVAGKTAVAAERIHATMRRIAVAAAEISQHCATGQQSLHPAQLPVTADDRAALEET